MEAEINDIDQDEKIAVVLVYDNDGWEHQVYLDSDGEVLRYGQERFPLDPDERTEFQKTVENQVITKAQSELYEQLGWDAIPNDIKIDEHRRAIRTIRSMPDDRFREFFEPWFEALRDPPYDVDPDAVTFLAMSIQLADDADRVTKRGPIKVSYKTGPESVETLGQEDDFPYTVILNDHLYEFDFEFPGDFREFLVSHLKCQIRDIYLNRGDAPPDEYDVDGMGKIWIYGRASPTDEYVTG